MPSDHRRWFNSPAHADTLLRIRFQLSDPGEPAAEDPAPSDVDGMQPNAQLVGMSKQTPDPDKTGHAEQGGSSNSRTKERDTLCGEDYSGSDPGSERGGEASQPVRTYHAHAVFLRGQSAYFDASLGEVWQQLGQQDQQQQHQQQQEQGSVPLDVPRAPAAVLDLHLDPGEEDAMDLLLRFMYGHPLPAVTPDTTPLLFQCLHLADRFDVPHCVSAILSTLKGLQRVAMSAAMLQCVGHAPPGILGRPDFEALLSSAKRFVIDTYGNCPAVVRSKKLRRGFCAVPFVALLAWAKSDKLRVHSENCVVYLLSMWVQAAQRVGGQGVSAEQLEQLAQQVRVLHLGPAYQHHILPQLGWFKGCSCSVHLPTLLAFKSKDAAGRAVFPANGVEFPDVHRKFPAQWVAKARQRGRVTDADQVLRWEVGDGQLQFMSEYLSEAGEVRVCSPPLYLNGFMLRMTACSGEAAHSGGAADVATCKTLGLYVGVDPVHAQGAIPWPETAAVKLNPVELRVLHGPEGGVSRMLSFVVHVGTSDWGYSSMLGGAVPSVSDLVAPYLKDGKLHVEARFTTVDQP